MVVGTVSTGRYVRFDMMEYEDLDFFTYRLGLVCRINNGSTLEEHLEFWILVAGIELDWRDHVEDVNNKVTLPGDDDKDCIGKQGNIVGTVTAGKLLSLVEDKRSKSAVVRGSRLMEQQFSPYECYKNIKVLVYAQPPALKSLCRKTIRKYSVRKQGIIKNLRFKEMMEKTNLRKYLAFRA